MSPTSTTVDRARGAHSVDDTPLATVQLDYPDPTERRLVRLERSLGFWRVMAAIHLVVAIILLWLFAFYIFPKLIHA